MEHLNIATVADLRRALAECDSRARVYIQVGTCDDEGFEDGKLDHPISCVQDLSDPGDRSNRCNWVLLYPDMDKHNEE